MPTKLDMLLAYCDPQPRNGAHQHKQQYSTASACCRGNSQTIQRISFDKRPVGPFPVLNLDLGTMIG